MNVIKLALIKGIITTESEEEVSFLNTYSYLFKQISYLGEH